MTIFYTNQNLKRYRKTMSVDFRENGRRARRKHGIPLFAASCGIDGARRVLWLFLFRWSLDEDVSSNAFRTMASVSLLNDVSAKRLLLLFEFAAVTDKLCFGRCDDCGGGGGSGIDGGLFRMIAEDAIEPVRRLATDPLARLMQLTPFWFRGFRVLSEWLWLIWANNDWYSVAAITIAFSGVWQTNAWHSSCLVWRCSFIDRMTTAKMGACRPDDRRRLSAELNNLRQKNSHRIKQMIGFTYLWKRSQLSDRYTLMADTTIFCRCSRDPWWAVKMRHRLPFYWPQILPLTKRQYYEKVSFSFHRQTDERGDRCHKFPNSRCIDSIHKSQSTINNKCDMIWNKKLAKNEWKAIRLIVKYCLFLSLTARWMLENVGQQCTKSTHYKNLLQSYVSDLKWNSYFNLWNPDYHNDIKATSFNRDKLYRTICQSIVSTRAFVLMKALNKICIRIERWNDCVRLGYLDG